MATVSSRYQNYSSSANGSNNGRRLSTAPFTNNSPVNGRHLSVVSQPLRPLSRSDDHFTELIELALQTAQNAVLLDHQRNGAAALDGYSQCCAILAEVIQRETDADEITRIRQIHDTYTVRMHVLSGELQLDPNHLQRQMPPLPTQADIQEFEDEEDEEEILASFRQIRTSNHDPIVSKQPNQRYTEVRPLDIQTSRPPLHRSTSSRDSTRGPPSARKSTHGRSTSFSRTHSQQDSLGSLEQIPSTPVTASFRPLSSRDTMLLPEMIDEEEMDDAAFLERITRGFTSDEEFLEDEATRPSTSSTTSSGHRQSHPKNNLSQSFVFDQIPPMARTESEDFLVPSPQSATATPRPPPSPTRPQHNRARNTSSPLPTSGMTTPRPSSAKKNLSISGAQPMYKSLSANNAIPNPDEVIVPGNAETAPKIKKRPHLIRVVSESTMRANYGSQRLSTFDNVSPGSPPSTGGSLLTPGTTTSSGFLTDSPSANFLQNRDGAGAAEDPPEDPYLRPYWLMRALALSMKNQKGAYLNSQLFVPQGVWMLKNVKLKATDEKITCFSAMTMAVRQVLDIDYGNSSILLQVGNLEGTMDIVQQNLLRKMDGKINGTSGTNGDGRQMTRKMSQTTLLGGWGKRLRSKSSASQTIISPNTPSGKELGPDSAYPNAILALFECALVLEQKFDTLEPEDMPIKTQLRLDASRRRIAEFFANVVIRFVLQDLQMLMSKYVKRANEWMMS